MAKYQGTLRKSDMAGGAWTLVTDQGVVYQLEGFDGGSAGDGQRVVASGEIATDRMSIAMVGDILRVTSVVPAS